MDPAEADTLRSIISGCPDNAADTALPAPVVAAAQPAAEKTAAQGTGAQDGGCHPDYSPCIPHLKATRSTVVTSPPVRNLSLSRVAGVDPYQLDRDGDARGCTS